MVCTLSQSKNLCIRDTCIKREVKYLWFPLRRLRKPISDEEALAIGKAFDVPSLFEHVARARRRVVGAMFPTDIA